MIKNPNWLRGPLLIISVLILLAVLGWAWTATNPSFSSGETLSATKLNQIHDSIDELRNSVDSGGGGGAAVCNWDGQKVFKMSDVVSADPCGEDVGLGGGQSCCGDQFCMGGECVEETKKKLTITCENGGIETVEYGTYTGNCYCTGSCEPTPN